MIKGVIFDFMRTIYLPETDKIPEETIKLLFQLKYRGLILGLISKLEAGRQDKIKPVAGIFSDIRIVDKKSEKDFVEMLDRIKLKSKEVIVVGDRIKNEIKLAKNAGIKTVWFRNGKFKEELPERADEKPDYIITNLNKLPQILYTLNKGE